MFNMERKTHNVEAKTKNIAYKEVLLNAEQLTQTDSTNNFSQITDILEGFKSYQLTDLDKANLMDRVDVKFMLPITFLPYLLEQIKHDYSVLDINGKRTSRYHNQYYDTKGMSFYHDHHNGKLNRFKVRQRTYLDTDTSFLEVKFKNNKKRTIKSRINSVNNEHNKAKNTDFIHQEMGRNFDELMISQQGGYQRIALANEASAERLTIDFDLWYQLKQGDKKLTLPGFFIAELKQKKRSKLSPFYQLMSKNNISPIAFSKYCIGCALLYHQTIKTNRFKAPLIRVKKFALSNNNNNQLSN